MKRKLFTSFIACFLVISFLVPSIPSFAYEGFKVGLEETLDEIYPDAYDYTGRLYKCTTSWFSSWDQTDYSNYMDLSSMTFDPFNNESLWVTGKGSSTGNMTIWCIDLTGAGRPYWSCWTDSTGYQIAAFYQSDPGVQSVPYYVYIYNCLSNSWSQYTTGSISLTTPQMMSSTTNDQNGLEDIPSGQNTVYAFQWASNSTFLWGNVDHVYSYSWWYHEDSHLYNPSALSNIPNNFPLFSYSKYQSTGASSGFIDFFRGGEVYYWNGEDFVDGADTGEESNENHMYFKSCNIGFAEPNNVNSFTQFGGAYVYFKYDVDQWVNDHIDEYYIEIEGTLSLDGHTRSGGTLLRLDPDGCTTVPLSDLFGQDVVNAGVVTYTVNRTVEQNFLQSYLYSMSNATLTRLLQGDSSSGSSGSLLSALTELGNYAASELRSLWVIASTGNTVVCNKNYPENQGGVTLTPHTDFKITLDCNLQDSNGNESGEIGKMFDLYKGSDVVTDSSGLRNEDPYEIDPIGEDFLPDIPNDSTVVNSGSGSVNVYNMTPSEVKLVIDNGLDKFVNWYNTSNEVGTTVNGFWASFGIFKNNPATDLYEEYFGFLPTEFKTIMLGAATIGIVGCVFSMLRRKLT